MQWAAPSGYRMRSTYFGDYNASYASTIQNSINYAQSQYDLPGAMSYINAKWQAFTQLSVTIPQLQHTASTLATQAAQLGHSDIQQTMQGVITYLGQLNVMQGSLVDKYDTLVAGLRNIGYAITGQPTSSSMSPTVSNTGIPGVIDMGYTDVYNSVPDTSVDNGVVDQTDSWDSYGTLSGFGLSPMIGAQLGEADPATLITLTALAILIAGTMLYINYHVSEQSAAITTAQQTIGLLQQGKITAQQAQQMIQSTGAIAAQSTSTGLSGFMSNLSSLAVPLVIGAIALFVVPDLIKASKRKYA